LGIELNEYAAELARLTLWIGELQWRIEQLDHIECRDALLFFVAGGQWRCLRASACLG
jgi:hypothetical protein